MRARAFSAAAVLATCSVAASAGPAVAGPIGHGPSTTTDPYVVPAADGVSITSILTVDDPGSASNGYELAGIPDGLGATRKGDKVSVQLNHELTSSDGAVRAHGQLGAFVSTWSIDRRTLNADSGADFIKPGVQFWDYASQTYGLAPSAGGANPRVAGDIFPVQSSIFARFCSATLSAPGQFLGDRGWRRSRGYGGQIYFANEENGLEGRTFGVLEDGTAKQLPRLGLFSWENTVPAFNESDTTLVMGQEDNASGQLWAYVGRKSRKGDAFRRAGLTNGADFVIDAAEAAVTNDTQFRAAYPKGTPAAVELNNVDWDASGARQNTEAAADGLSLNRTEDGAWDPRNPDDYYFVTTAGSPEAGSSPARDGGGLWRLHFDDIENPEDGGTLTLLLDGSESPKLFNPDNITVDHRGHVLIQEDPGGNDHVATVYAYDIASGRVAELGTFDPELFTPGKPGFITNDEESSGIIDAERQWGRGYFLFDAQVHKKLSGPLVEMGQLMLMRVKNWHRVFGETWGDDD